MTYGATGYGYNEFGATMTVHMIEFHAEYPAGVSLSEVQAAVDNWMANNTVWPQDTANQRVSVRTPADPTVDTPEWLAMRVRFEDTDTKSTLLTEAENVLQQYIQWYRIGYHICDHDAAERTGCSWDDVREWTAKKTTIPSEVPTFL